MYAPRSLAGFVSICFRLDIPGFLGRRAGPFSPVQAYAGRSGVGSPTEANWGDGAR
jgi:hypothetical protein